MLRTSELTVFYENAIAVNNVDIEIEEGEIVGLFGPNGAGKSTLMYTISGVILDKKKKEEMRGGERITILGSIEYEKKNITFLKPSKRAEMGIILCPERRRVFPESSVVENLKIGGYLRSWKDVKEDIEKMFEIFPELEKHKNKPAGFLSGGEQQMLAIARALMAKPKLLLLDEPLLGLAPLVQKRIVEVVKRIRDELGVTVLIAEQYARPVFPIIDRGYIIERGTISFSGTSEELMSNPNVKAAYLGV